MASAAAPWAVVTGCNSGIGFALAVRMIKNGRRVLATCRNNEKAEDARTRILSAVGSSCGDGGAEDILRMGVVDFESFASVRDFAGEISSEPINCLVNNAGMMAAEYRETSEGIEATWCVNTASQYLLTRLLMPTLARQGTRDEPSRCILVGSRLERRGHVLERIDEALDHAEAQNGGGINVREGWTTFGSYSNSKQAASNLFLGMARTAPENVLVRLCTPGMVHTGLSRFLPQYLQYLAAPIQYLLLQSPDAGCDTPFWLATGDVDTIRGEEGLYFGKRKPIEASEGAKDADLNLKLERLLERQCREYL